MPQTELPQIIHKSLDSKDLQIQMLAWFERHARVMPWRKTKDPYAIWLSETMLQQTQVATVTPYYEKFYKRFPTVADLAQADLQEVLSMWAGLGYYRRAKHLHAAARMIVEKCAGKVPATSAQLLDLPGVGRYTAAAVASIAFGERIGVLDGNVIRVLSRVLGEKSDFSVFQNRLKLQKIADFLVPSAHPGAFNESMMELGATICTPTRPDCQNCPINAHCQALRLGIQDQLPVKKKSADVPTLRRVAAVICRDGATGDAAGAEVLLMQRPAGVVWEQMWEFPTLEVSNDEWLQLDDRGEGRAVKSGKKGPASARKREKTQKMQLSDFNWLTHFADEVRKQLGLRVELDRWLGSQGHQLTHRTMDYRVIRGHLKRASCEQVPELPRCERGRYMAFRWESVARLAAKRTAVPVARVTDKIAAMAGCVERGEGSARLDR